MRRSACKPRARSAFADEEDCPLDARGVQVAAAGRHALSLTTKDEALPAVKSR
jgi:hypothetical protein